MQQNGGTKEASHGNFAEGVGSQEHVEDGSEDKQAYAVENENERPGGSNNSNDVESEVSQSSFSLMERRARPGTCTLAFSAHMS